MSKRARTAASRLIVPTGNFERLTHYLFRYPAKFHPPVVSHLIREHSKPGDVVLDPFCGSGTTLVEARANGRSAIGFDVDPVAGFCSRVKSHRYRRSNLERHWNSLRSQVMVHQRRSSSYMRLMFDDITDGTMRRRLREEGLWVPEIPNLTHWFRRYVVVDLARILHEVERHECGHTTRQFFRLCFASIIRNASNADPVPVSGLEVTSHMKQRDKNGRRIDPFALFDKAVRSAIKGVGEFCDASTAATFAIASCADVTERIPKFRTHADCVVTSPPYLNAVDYYRRHQLEMFWLRFTETQHERERLIPKYVGRYLVSKAHPHLREAEDLPARGLEIVSRVAPDNHPRRSSILQYCVAMRLFFANLRDHLRKGVPTVVVVGDCRFSGKVVPVAELLEDLAADWFQIVERQWYPLTNRYMSYTRNNNADIDKEMVLVFAPH